MASTAKGNVFELHTCYTGWETSVLTIGTSWTV